jgi:nucleoporin NDC1
MWELALIARNFETQRKAIYEDIDRKDGPMWSQVYANCLEIIKGMEARVDSYGKKPAEVAPVPAPDQKVAEKKKNPALREDPIFTSTPQKRTLRDEVGKVVGKVARSPGQGSAMSPVAKRVIDLAKEGFIQVHQKATGSDDPQGSFQNLLVQALTYPTGYPFQKDYRRQVAVIVLGTPYGEPSLYINAISALSQLVSHSLAEDRYGNVQRDVPAILRAFTTVTKKLETFKTTLPVHWTDVAGRRESPEVDEILQTLKAGLNQLIQDFGPYARDLRLSATDMRLAREAAAVEEPEQMRQV